ncbi:MAG TPA: hypothetical protein VG710_18535, partial [Opitutus sp.]|nr:hypothetical protein [Opitutus sp.]
MDLLAFVLICARILLLLAGLLLPGAMLLRALRLPPSLGLSFVGSAVLLYTTGLALDLAGIPLSLAPLSAVLAVVTLALAWWGRDALVAPSDAGPALAPFTRLGTLTPLFLLFWSVIAFLLIREPLAGPDTQFRWAFLPEQWLRLGNLDFYPPVSAHDFLSYFWAESIPPGVASLHAWAFACGESFAPAWTTPVTALEFLAVHDLAWRTGFHFGGNRAARASALLVAACPLLAWSLRLAQETGLTAVATLALAFTLAPFVSPAPGQCHVLRDTPQAAPASASWAAAAGLAGALGALTREYGLVFPFLGIIVL